MQDRPGYHSPYFQPSSNKPPTPSAVLSKSTLIQWLRNTLSQNDVPNNVKVEDLGTGVIFCKLINHYYSHIIQQNRIINNPRNQYQGTLNLKLLQNALVQLKINVPLDVGKISKMKFLENWNLLNALYKHFNHNDLELSTGANEDCKSISGSINFPTFGSMGSISGTASVCKGLKRPNDNSYTKETKFQSNLRQKQTVLLRSNSIPSLHQFSNNASLNFSQVTMPLQTGRNQHQNTQNLGFNNLQRHYSKQQFNGYSSVGKHYKQNQYQNPAQRNTISDSSSVFIQGLNPQKSLFQNNTPQFVYQNNNGSTNNLQSIQSSRHSSPMKGKWSVNSNFFTSNHHAIIDRVKQILLKSSNDTEKIRQVKTLMGICIDEDLVKIQDDMNNYTTIIQPQVQKEQCKQPKTEQQKQNATAKGNIDKQDSNKQIYKDNNEEILKQNVSQER